MRDPYIDVVEKFTPNGTLIVPEGCICCFGCSYYENQTEYCYSYAHRVDSRVKARCDHFIGFDEMPY